MWKPHTPNIVRSSYINFCRASSCLFNLAMFETWRVAIHAYLPVTPPSCQDTRVLLARPCTCILLLLFCSLAWECVCVCVCLFLIQMRAAWQLFNASISKSIAVPSISHAATPYTTLPETHGTNFPGGFNLSFCKALISFASVIVYSLLHFL